jgi:hypothetical protein
MYMAYRITPAAQAQADFAILHGYTAPRKFSQSFGPTQLSALTNENFGLALECRAHFPRFVA